MKNLLLLLLSVVLLSSCATPSEPTEQVIANVKNYKVMNVDTHVVSIAHSEEPVHSAALWIFNQGDTITVNIRSGYVKPIGKTMRCVVLDYIN